jgi:hypothetical protein
MTDDCDTIRTVGGVTMENAEKVDGKKSEDDAADLIRLDQEAVIRRKDEAAHITRLEQGIQAKAVIKSADEKAAAESIQKKLEAEAAEYLRNKEIETLEIIRVKDKAVATEVMRLEEERATKEVTRKEKELQAAQVRRLKQKSEAAKASAETTRLETLRVEGIEAQTFEFMRLEEEKAAAANTSQEKEALVPIGGSKDIAIENVEDYNNDINDDFYADDDAFHGNMSVFLST